MTSEEWATNITDLVLVVDSKSKCKKFIAQGIAAAVAEAEAVAHATGRLNMAIAVEQEQERIRKAVCNVCKTKF